MWTFSIWKDFLQEINVQSPADEMKLCDYEALNMDILPLNYTSHYYSHVDKEAHTKMLFGYTFSTQP